MEDKKNAKVTTEVTTEIKEPEEKELMEMDKEDIVKMFLRLVEAKNFIQLELMSLAVSNERTIKVIKHLNNQLKGKDVFIEAVLEKIGRDKLPDGMELFSGDDYVYFWEDIDQKLEKVDLVDNVKNGESKRG